MTSIDPTFRYPADPSIPEMFRGKTLAEAAAALQQVQAAQAPPAPPAAPVDTFYGSLAAQAAYMVRNNPQYRDLFSRPELAAEYDAYVAQIPPEHAGNPQAYEAAATYVRGRHADTLYRTPIGTSYQEYVRPDTTFVGAETASAAALGGSAAPQGFVERIKQVAGKEVAEVFDAAHVDDRVANDFLRQYYPGVPLEQARQLYEARSKGSGKVVDHNMSASRGKPGYSITRRDPRASRRFDGHPDSGSIEES